MENNLNIIGIDYSPIKGPEGNIEYLVYFNKDSSNNFDMKNIDSIVQSAHSQLK